MLEQRLKIPLTFASREEKKCSQVLERFLDWKAELGRTYQYPLSKKHDADFYLPNQNLILEYHPPVIKWYGADGSFKRLARLREKLAPSEYYEVQDLVANQISHEYFKRRRALMDLGGHQDKRLIVVKDFEELFQNIIRPYAVNKIGFKEFKKFLDQL